MYREILIQFNLNVKHDKPCHKSPQTQNYKRLFLKNNSFDFREFVYLLIQSDKMYVGLSMMHTFLVKTYHNRLILAQPHDDAVYLKNRAFQA